MPAGDTRLLLAAVARAEIAANRLRELEPQGLRDRIPEYLVGNLAYAFDVRSLRGFLRIAEREAYAAGQLEQTDFAFWQCLVTVYRRAIVLRRHVEDYRAARRPRTRRGGVNFEEIKRRVDIVEYIGRYTALRKQGRSFVGRCVFHSDEHRPNLVVWPEPPVFKCFACGAKGDIITFRKLLRESDR